MKESFKKIIGFDTETVLKNGKQSFYSFQVYSPELELNDFHTDPDVLRHLFTYSTRGCYLVCANAEFDISVIADILEKSGLKIEMVYTSSKFIRGRIKDENRNTWHIIDVFNLFPRYSVHKLGNLLKLPKLDRPEYLGKREPETNEMDYFIKYAMRDAEIAYLSARMVIEEFTKLKPTLPSLTMSLYRKQRKDFHKWQQPDNRLHEKIRLCYRGGRVEPFARGTLNDDVFAFDVRSLYPSVMVEGIFPDVTQYPEEKTSIDYDNEGCALVELKQNCNIPALAVKHNLKDIGVRLVFPNGKVKDWFTYPELRYIEDNNFGEVNEVFQAIEWKNNWQDNLNKDVDKFFNKPSLDIRKKRLENDDTTQFEPFREWTEYLFSKRAKYLAEQNDKAEMYKLMMNALYGKFGQNLESSSYEFKAGKLHNLGKEGGISKNTHFIIAAYVTAYGRIKLHEYMMRHGGDDILYCDTDGFLTTKRDYPHREILGGLTRRFDKKPIRMTTVVRSKMYIIDNEVKMRGLYSKMDGNMLRVQIIRNKVEASKLVLLKPRQASRMHKEPLTEYVKNTNFSLKMDGKRNYNKSLDGDKLIFDFTMSQPIEIN